MKTLSARHLKELVETQKDHCISFYMPTGRAGPEIRQNPIRFKNLLKEAEKKLKERHLRATKVEGLLEPARGLLKDSNFWEYQGNGLAVFLSPQMIHYYRLPMTIPKLVVVANRFHIKPLVPMLIGDGTFYLLALSLNQVRLYQCTRDNILEVKLEGVPTSLQEALKYDDPERQLQYHTGTPGRSGKRAAIYHGQGVGVDEAEHKKEILRFFQQLDNGLHNALSGEHSPMVLAGVEYLLPIFQRACDYPAIVDEHIPGNPEDRSPEQLHDRAWSLVEPLFLEAQSKAMERYRQLMGSEETSEEIAEIVPAAFYDRVDTLFVARGRQRWGSFDPQSSSVRLSKIRQAGDEDLLDTATAYTLINGGNVYAPEPEKMPRQTMAAAIFRFPIGISS